MKERLREVHTKREKDGENLRDLERCRERDK
jgi:hypothetical protein